MQSNSEWRSTVNETNSTDLEVRVGQQQAPCIVRWRATAAQCEDLERQEALLTSCLRGPPSEYRMESNSTVWRSGAV
eukprot:1153088-Pelagomonas_calceolata.AAC.8